MPDANDATAGLSVSVAMATYNGARFIRSQLDSIAAQTIVPDELVVTDDQSTDDTEMIVAAFAATVPFPVRFHRNAERLGFAHNFGRAIGLCRSDLIFLCDQDDVWQPDKVALMRMAFADDDVLLAYHNATVTNAAGEGLYPFYDGAVEQAALAVSPPHPWHASFGMTQVFRAALREHDDLWPESLNHVELENEMLAHDQWYFFLAQLMGRVAFIDRPLVGYRQHGSNVVGASWEMAGRGFVNRLRARVAHRSWNDEVKRQAAERRAVLLDQLARRMPAKTADRASAMARNYRALGTRLARRYRTFRAPRAPARLASLLGAIVAGDYRGRPWAFDPRSAARDLVGGVFALSPPEKVRS